MFKDMGELAPEFVQKIAHFDGNSQINEQEKEVISYLESYVRNMPPAYLNKLIEAIKEKLKNKELSKDQIRKECEASIRALSQEVEPKKEGRWFMDKISAFASDAKVQVEIFASRGDLIQVFRDGVNISIPVKEFEKEFKTHNIKDINSLGLANYFLHLNEKKWLTIEELISKFWSDKLLELGNIWSKGGNPAEGEKRLVAKSVLENNGLSGFVATIVALSSQESIVNQMTQLKKPEQQEAVILLLKDKHSTLRTKLKNDVKTELLKRKPPMNEEEANKKSEEVLTKILKHKSFESLTELYKEINNSSKELGIHLDKKATVASVKAVQKAGNEYETAVVQKSLMNEKNPEEQKKKKVQLQQLAHEKKSIEMASKVNNKIEESDISRIVSGEKKMEQVVAELRKKDKSFDQEYTAWEKEKAPHDDDEKKKKAPKEESNTKPKQSETWDVATAPIGKISDGIFDAMPLGTERDVRLSQGPNAPTIRIEKVSERQYYVTIAGNTMKMTSSELPGHISSCRFLQNTGLEAMMHIPPPHLTEIMQACSKDGNKVNDSDGNFSSKEKMLVLQAMAHILGIENIGSGVGMSTLRNNFKTALNNKGGWNPQEWFKKLAQIKWFMNDAGVINPELLKTAILAQKTA